MKRQYIFLGTLLIGILVLLSYKVTYSLLTDTALSSNSSFAAAVFPTQAITGIPTTTPPVTPTEER